ncbi:efflux RND transporter periplasmic adaptor subunit [Pendulispora albinea]|uniref:Efflux RND transporter periplasmic adaptor subunit n=1 Tax=Pendulispora albinea TaxID=2741071 RepID=A0ABZ2MA43_9BACT
MHPSSRPHRGKLLVIAIAVAALAVGAFLHFRSKKDTGSARTAAVRDVPRLDGNAIVFSDAFRERATIAFSPVEQRPFQPTVRVVGTVAFNPSFVAAIGTRLRGFVRKTFKYEGDRVREGEALAEVESAELGEAQSSITQAHARLDAAERNAKRERDLLARQLTTAREAEVAEAELAMQRAALQAAEQRTKAYGGAGSFGVFVLRSPLDGHVVERNVSPGQSVDGELIGYKVADLNHLWIELSVFERDIGFVHVGDAVVVSPVASGGVKIPGTVAHVGEIIDPATRSTGVRVAVDNPSHHLRPGQSVHATITSGDPAHTALLIPHDAVVYVDGKATVFVAETETRVRPVAVHLGGSDGTRHEVVEGLEAGQRVAAAGVFALKSELFR